MFNKLITVFRFFDEKSKKRLFYSQFIILLASLFEILSIFSIGPLVEILNNPNSVYDKEQFVSKIYYYFNFSSFESFVAFFIAVIFILFFLTAVIVIFNSYIITIFAQNLGNDLRSNILKFYLHQPWLYHSRLSNSALTTKIIQDTSRVTNNVIFNILITNSKLVTGFFIIIFLTFYNYQISFVAISVIGLMYLIIFSIVKKKMEIYGVVQSTYLSQLFRIINHCFQGFKETIIYDKKKSYYDDFSKTGKIWGQAFAKQHFLTLAPRNFLEFFAFSIILLFIAVMIFSEKNNFNETLPVISVYIFAGYKLLPIFQSVYQGIANLKGNLYAIDNVKNELNESKKYLISKESNKTNSLNLKDEVVFKMNDVSFSYKDTDKAVNNINLEIKEKTLNFIVGQSGSGKSTLLDLILGLIYPRIGKIQIGSDELTPDNCSSWHHNLGYVGQNVFLIDDTIKKNICLNDFDQKIDEEKFQKVLKLSYVDKFLNDTPNGVETIVGERGIRLSGGQRQRIAIARALYKNKKILVLDEATASLDGIAEKFIIDQFQELSKNVTIIMVTHNIKLCKNADMIYLLDNGFIKKTGKYEDLIQESLFRKLLNE